MTAFAASKQTTRFLLSLFVLCFFTVSYGNAFQDYKLSKGQTVYVPAYSNITTVTNAEQTESATTLIIRNTDAVSSLTVASADFYNAEGYVVKKCFERPVIVRPLGTRYVTISSKESAGKEGTNFIVRWQSDKQISVPIIECVVSGTKSGQEISFIGQGRVIKE